VVMHQATDKTTGQNKGIARLGVMIDFYPLANPTEENKIQQFYSMGTKAAESFAPNPETGKGIVRIPGGGSKGGKGGMFEGTNWSLYLQSLYQSSMPEGVFVNDVSAIDGVWIYVVNQDEPESRKSMKNNMQEVEQDANRKPMKVAVVSEILEGGKPWEGGGGFPAATPVAAPVAARPVAARPPVARPAAAAAPRPVAVARPAAVAPRPVTAPRPVAAPAPPAPVAAAAPASDFEDIKAWASAAINDVLTKNLNGLPRTILRNNVFKYLEKQAGNDMAGLVISNIFEIEDNLLIALGELNYTVQGPAVVPAA